MPDLSLSHVHGNPHSHSAAEPMQCETSARHDSFEDEDGPFGLVPEELLGKMFEIIPGRLSFTIHGDDDHTKKCIKEYPHLFFFSAWMQEAYDSFFSDFGPCNISLVVRFCDFLKQRLQDPRLARRHLVYYCEPNKNVATNGAFLLGAYLVLLENWSPERAADCFQTFSAPPFYAFRDATTHASTFDLSILDCLRGLRRAVEAHIFDVNTFDIATYEDLDDPQVADLHIICPKFVAFRGPTAGGEEEFAHSAEHYVPLFEKLGVGCVVRLNERSTYSAAVFERHAIRHHDLEFSDGCAPSLSQCEEFLRICDAEKRRVAVHCKAGLGRTGTMIAVWMMREYGWSAPEAIAWLRLVRPGSVMGPQQHFLLHAHRLLQKTHPFPFRQHQLPFSASFPAFVLGTLPENSVVDVTG